MATTIDRRVVELLAAFHATILLLLALALPAAAAADETGDSLYIVHLRSAPPLTGYHGGIPGFPATASNPLSRLGTALNRAGRRIRRRLPRLDLKLPHVKAFVNMLDRLQAKVAKDVGLANDKLLHSYKVVSNGFSATLSPKQVADLLRHPDVASVTASVRQSPLTSHSPEFLGLPGSLWKENGGQGNAGEGVIVGIVDTGIWPEYPSFSDNVSLPYADIPARWKGVCSATADFPATACNKKLIGARYYTLGLTAAKQAVETSKGDFESARDSMGHGTHCAGIAVGNSGVEATGFSSPISGVAPRARLAVYKVCWLYSDSIGCEDADIEAAMNDAVADGVDVISLSLGSPGGNYLEQMIYMRAYLAGVAVVMAAGNSGRPPAPGSWQQLSNTSPFVLTVGASSIARQQAKLVFPDSTELRGFSLIFFDIQAPLFGPTLAAAADGTTAGGTVAGSGAGLGTGSGTGSGAGTGAGAGAADGNNDKQYCARNSLTAEEADNKIVICMLGGGVTVDEVLQEVNRNRGLGVVLVGGDNQEVKDSLYTQSLPLMIISSDKKEELFTLAETHGEAQLLSKVELKSDMAAPTVAKFSSAGPTIAPTATPSRPNNNNDVLKPDVIAPGVKILSPWRPADVLSAPSDLLYRAASGTSMATPHVAGLAALVIQKVGEGWSAGQVMSAIVTTASGKNRLGKPIGRELEREAATPWDMGSGQVTPAQMLDPGLTFEMDEKNCYGFIAGQATAPGNYVPSGLSVKAIKGYELNRPNIAVSKLKGSVTIMRRVKNVHSETCRYTSSVQNMTDVSVTVKPTAFVIEPGKELEFSVQLTPLRGTNKFSYGGITWRDDKGHEVKMVLEVQPSNNPKSKPKPKKKRWA
ncbi:hypothetical protein CLOM_g11389 [Closterium sp. NIES-68]|nr:hypothetical protein CLOM_g11389 [Closterium sp. NIES-68]GJP79507.1 hypothetical protein CLOP_g9735 [Closterium sp. NIES-67]